MGLDNGILLKIKKNSAIEVPKFIQIDHDDYYSDNYDSDVYEIGYWRKCWQLRDDIIDSIEVGQQGGDYYLNKKNLKKVIGVLKYYYLTYSGLKSWSDSRMYYWDEPDTDNPIMYVIDRFAAMKARKAQGKIMLKQLEWCLKNIDNKEIKVIFYDSY